MSCLGATWRGRELTIELLEDALYGARAAAAAHADVELVCVGRHFVGCVLRVCECVELDRCVVELWCNVEVGLDAVYLKVSRTNGGR